MFLRILSSWKPCKLRQYCTISKILNDGPRDSPITIRGWILHRREHKRYEFFVITDGLSPDTVQMVVEKPLIQPMKAGSAVVVTGRLIPSKGRGQQYDFLPDSVHYVGENNGENPIVGKDKLDIGFSRQYLHLRPKLMSVSSLFRIRNAAKNWLHRYFQDRNFLYIDTPIFTMNDCEGGGEAFYVEPADKVKFGDAVVREIGPDGQEHESKRYFFSRPTYTTVSAQLHLEAAACAFRQVYTFNPTFRAESSLSRHHLAEFYMLEAEIAFINDLDPLLNLVEDVFRKCSLALMNENAADYQHCAKHHDAEHMKTVQNVLTSTAPYVRMSYKEATEILMQAASKNVVSTPVRGNFTREQERYLVNHCGNMPLFVLDFPANAKPFYMARSKADPEAASCFDFLVPLADEIVGGSLRESDYATLEHRLKNTGHREKLSWYLDLRRFGYPRTGGFGLGFERYLQWLLGVNNVKDCMPFPRWYNHCYL